MVVGDKKLNTLAREAGSYLFFSPSLGTMKIRVFNTRGHVLLASRLPNTEEAESLLPLVFSCSSCVSVCCVHEILGNAYQMP